MLLFVHCSFAACTTECLSGQFKSGMIVAIMKSEKKRKILTIKEQVYQVLRQDIVSGVYQPGDRINEVEVAKDLEVSRSPVHSAITELIGEGLLESIPNKAVKVRQLSHKQILDIFEYRVLVESYALERLIEDLSEADVAILERYKQEFSENGIYEKLPEYVDVDARFHKFLVDCSGNNIVSDSFYHYSVLITPFRIISLTSRERFSSSVREHTQIIDAILKHDAARAVAVNKEHLMLASKEIEKYLTSNETTEN